jgi:hypothetical protein
MVIKAQLFQADALAQASTAAATEARGLLQQLDERWTVAADRLQAIPVCAFIPDLVKTIQDPRR